MSVNTIITDANSRTQSAVDEAQSFIDQLSDIAADTSLGLSGTWSIVPWFDLSPGYAIPQVEVLDYSSPTIRSVGIDDVALPDDPSTDQPVVWDNANIPEFTDSPLPLDLPDAPTTPVPTAPEEYTPKDITLDAFQDYSFPDDPARTEGAFPTVPDIDIETVDLTVPDLDELGVIAPNNDFEYVETEYSSALLTALENLLISDLVDGGYGINDADEQALWDRAKDRQAKLNAAALLKVRRGMASRNFPMPPGALYAAEQEIQKEGDAALSEVNREIMLKRSDLYVQARQFAVQQGISLEEALMRYVAAKWERALKAAIASAELAITYHNAAVAMVALRLDVRRIYRDLHEEQRLSVMVALEQFRAKLQLIDAEEGRNTGRLRFYEGLRQGVLDHYKVQQLRDQHDMLDAEIERLKLEASKTRAEIFGIKVRARSDEFQAYATAINAERSKVDLFSAQVQAYDARLTAAIKEAEIKQRRFEAELKLKVDERERIKLLLAKYEGQVRTNIAEAQLDAEYNKDLLTMWRAGLDTQQFNVSKKLERDIARAKAYLDNVSTNTNQMNGALRAINDYKELKAQAAKSGVQLYETMIAGAEGALSAVASLAEAS